MAAVHKILGSFRLFLLILYKYSYSLLPSICYHLPQLLSLFKYKLEVMFLHKVKSENTEANLNMMGL